MKMGNPRGIVVIDVGYTNTKAILFSSDLKIVAKREMASVHRAIDLYTIIDLEPVLKFLKSALLELDRILPVDSIVPCAHGACMVSLMQDGALAVPVMDYASQPPADIIASYQKIEPPFSEVYCALLPMALTHGLQLFWQQHLFPRYSEVVKTILPLMQYVAFRLCGIAATEISSMSCQTQLLDINTSKPSSLAIRQGWDAKFAPLQKAWTKLGPLKPEFKNQAFNGRGDVLAGVHDSNANYLRYLAAGLEDFTLLSTGTWAISFNNAADITKLDHAKDTNTNTDVLGQVVACSRFFAGKELEVIVAGVDAGLANLDGVQKVVENGIMALPSFTNSGGPLPSTGNKGHITAAVDEIERASLASLYCAQMVSLQLSAVQSSNQIIVDGPFAENPVFLAVLGQLRSPQKVYASDLRDGTAAGAACLALMENSSLPKIDLRLNKVEPARLSGLTEYMISWTNLASPD